MLEPEQKRYLGFILLCIVVLVGLSLWRKSSFKFVPKQTTQVKSTAIDPKAYADYLNAIKTDPKASQAIYETVLTKDDIQKQVETELSTSQPIVSPSVDTTKLVISKDSSPQAISAYLSVSLGTAQNLASQTQNSAGSLFTQDKASTQAAIDSFQQAFQELQKQSVPKDAVAIHKSLLTAYAAYGDLLNLSMAYAQGSTDHPWEGVYKDYAVINNQAAIYQGELQRLAGKYQISSVPVFPHYAGPPSNNPFAIPQAQAFLGIGDVVVVIGDIPRIIMDAVKQGLAAAFSQFLGAMIGKLNQQIEKAYRISNFLYYSDALVGSQYVNDYLKKYVPDGLDQEMIKKFIPQLTCGQQPANLHDVFVAKAQQHLGFDPATLSYDDPDYYAKMAKVGDFLSSPTGWDLYYQDLAAQAESAAQKAAEQELTSSGLKTPRDTLNNTINISISNIVAAQRASIQGLMNLGIGALHDFISSFVATLTQTLVNNFIFQGASLAAAPGGNVGVLKEQTTCLAAAQIVPVLPLQNTIYNKPGPAVVLQINNQEDTSVEVGQDARFLWSSDGATDYSNSVELNGTDRCGTVQTLKNSVANSPEGSSTHTMQCCDAGNTYQVTFTAGNAQGRSSTTATVTVPMPPPPVLDAKGNVVDPGLCPDLYK